MIREIWGAADWNEDKTQHFLGILRVVQAMDFLSQRVQICLFGYCGY